MSSENRVKEGELFKYRNMFHGWKKYYFRLERSYLHYFEGKYISEPKATITRGEISQLTFSKESYGFDIHQTSGDIWHLQASSPEERMDWMRTLQPNAYFVDPCKENEPLVVEQSHPSAPQDQQPNQCSSHVEPIHPRLYPQLPTTCTCTSNASDTCMHQGHAPGPPNTPPPAYDEIYT